MGSLPQSPDTQSPVKLSAEHAGLIEDGGEWTRDVPQVARDFIATLQRRGSLDREPFVGGSYADRHLAETGHPFKRGCCARPENRCAGCRQPLPRAAKLKGESYCSRSCREVNTES
jgi:hypothetical protein